MRTAWIIRVTNIVILFQFSSAKPGWEPGSNFQSLGHYNVNPYMTVSGISAGGAFSMMLSFIHSSFVRGAGIFAGSPFPVAVVALEKLWNIGNFSAMIQWTDYLASKGWIDDPYENLPKSLGAFIYHGTADQAVPRFFSEMNLRQFQHYGVPRTKNMIGKVPSGHCIPINDTAKAFDYRICSVGFYNAVCSCSYPAIQDMFSFLYEETFVVPTYEAGTSGHLFKFNQDEYFDSGNAIENGFYSHGYAYVPYRCRPETGIRCRLHFAFQGCSQSLIDLWFFRRVPGFIAETGYLEVADANDIVLVFPLSFFDPKKLGFNFIGCYDIYSHTDPFRMKFATKWGKQPLAIKRMFERIVHGNFSAKDEYPVQEADKLGYLTKPIGRRFTVKLVMDSFREALRAIGNLGV